MVRILVFINLILLVLVLFILVRSIFASRNDKGISELRTQLSQHGSELLNSQQQLENQLSQGQQQLLALILQDRERQLNSLTELRVDLEKRFAESSTILTTNIHEFKTQMVEKFERLQKSSALSIAEGQQQLSTSINQFGEKFGLLLEKNQTIARDTIAENIRKGIQDLRLELDSSLKRQNTTISDSISKLTESTDNRLKDISGQVEKRLSDGFEKTTKTFNDVLKRLALIDDAQKKITELSSNVVSLQEILNDKRSRGAFGEVQLQSLISNTMPTSHFTMQYRFSNDKIADCVLQLPEPTGKIAIDAKFPLESYKKKMDLSLAASDRKEASRQFSRDIKKHITDISDKYILPPETSDGAVMFIPAESVFAEIHGHYPELVEYAYQRKVWMVSPTTLMAILTTASAVIKDEQTRKQVHIIKEHLSALGKDFGRFESRMTNLSKHIGMVSRDVEQVHTSAKKISSRFGKIENVELIAEDELTPLEPSSSINLENQSSTKTETV